jgi:hypothetical protein
MKTQTPQARPWRLRFLNSLSYLSHLSVVSLPYIGTLKDSYGANNAKNMPQMNKINTDFIIFTSNLSYLSVV